MTVDWHIVRAIPDRDMREALRRVGYELYYPMRRVTKPVAKRFLSQKQRRHHGQIVKSVLEPLFPTYVFMLFDVCDGRWQEFFRTLQIFNFGIFPGSDARIPCPVSPTIVQGLRNLEVEGAIQGATPINALPANCGDLVKIVDGGAFHGLTGTVSSIDSDNALSVLMQMMGRAVVLSNLKFESIEKVA